METLALDSTQISSWLSCERQWKLGYDEHLVPLTEKKAFSTGKLVHRLMETFYRLRIVLPNQESCALTLKIVRNWLNTGLCVLENCPPAIVDTLNFLTKVWQPEAEDRVLPTDEEWIFLSQRFIAYTQFYASDRFLIKDVEIGFSVPILETKEQLYVLEGRLDLLLADGENLYWVDHKSQERDYDHYQYNPQFLNYCVALGTRHGIVNYFGLQKNLPKGKDSFFRRKHVLASTEILKEWKLELIRIFSEVARTRRAGFFRKNRKSCKDGLNSVCPFVHICEQTHPGFEAEIKRTEFKEREPWSPWRLEENA